MNNVLNKQYPANLTIDEFTDDCKIFVENYSCPLCEGILFESVVDKCGHSFCKVCSDTLLTQTSKCPFTNIKLIPPFAVNIVVNSVIEKQKVFCKNKKKGCSWIGKLIERKEHLDNKCGYTIIDCPNAGCDQKAMRKDIEAHCNICEFKTIVCEYCKEKVLYKEIKEHIAQCPNLPCDCSNKCGQKVPLSKMNFHLENECDNTVVECPFGVVGCEFYEQRKALKAHLEKDLERHLRMVTGKISKLEGLITEQKTRIDTLETENGTLKTSIDNLNEKIDSQGKKMESVLNSFTLTLNNHMNYSIIPPSTYVPVFSKEKALKGKNIVFSLENQKIQKVMKNVGWFGINSESLVIKEAPIIINMKILQTSSSCIMLGISDYNGEVPLEKGFYHLTKGSYTFFCYNSSIYKNGVIALDNGELCNEGFIISLIITNKTIEFRKNGKSICGKINIEENKKYRVTVDMCDVGDTIEFLK